MLKGKRRTAVKVLLYAVTLIILYMLQAVVFSELKLLGVKPLIIPLAVVGVAIFEGSHGGGVFGLFAGMLFDIAYAQPLIEYTILMTALGIAVGLFADYVLSRRFPSYVLCCISALLLVSAVQMLWMLVFGGAQPRELLGTAWRQLVYSIIFIAPLYFPIKAIGKM
ncbi:MAG: hypothetical protein IKI49_06270 [Oscillospiraceae bacterium]|nr:hypothetical protein [Oscillospiraceae bacterium]